MAGQALKAMKRDLDEVQHQLFNNRRTARLMALAAQDDRITGIAEVFALEIEEK